jgi:hypothetical protein
VQDGLREAVDSVVVILIVEDLIYFTKQKQASVFWVR